MEFTYKSYSNMISNLMENGYSIASYDSETTGKCAIIRHDIDNSLEKARNMARIEADMGIQCHYFLMITSDFYNVFSKKSQLIIDEILGYNHIIGLHFDEARYTLDTTDINGVSEKIIEEADILSNAIGRRVTNVSMHRPNQRILDANLRIPGITNAYSKKFFKEYKYVSDSRRRWREPIDKYIRDTSYEKLHILIHPFWYNEDERDIYSSLRQFILGATKERYLELNDNFTELDQIIGVEEVTR